MYPYVFLNFSLRHAEDQFNRPAYGDATKALKSLARSGSLIVYAAGNTGGQLPEGTLRFM